MLGTVIVGKRPVIVGKRKRTIIVGKRTVIVIVGWETYSNCW